MNKEFSCSRCGADKSKTSQFRTIMYGSEISLFCNSCYLDTIHHFKTTEFDPFIVGDYLTNIVITKEGEKLNKKCIKYSVRYWENDHYWNAMHTAAVINKKWPGNYKSMFSTWKKSRVVNTKKLHDQDVKIKTLTQRLKETREKQQETVEKVKILQKNLKEVVNVANELKQTVDEIF